MSIIGAYMYNEKIQLHDKPMHRNNNRYINCKTLSNCGLSVLALMLLATARGSYSRREIECS